MKTYTGESQTSKNANYTLSIIPVLIQIDNELSTGKLSTYLLSDHYEGMVIDWGRCISSVIPVNLRYIVETKQGKINQAL